MNTFNTGLTVSNTSNLSTGQKIMVDQAMMAFEPAAPNKDLIDMHRIDQGYKQWEFGYYARLTDAAALTEGANVADPYVDSSADLALGDYSQLVRAHVTVTPSEHGMLTRVSKRAIMRQGDANVRRDVGTMLSNSLARRQDKDIITLYDGFSKTTPGGANSLEVDHLRNIIAYLMTDNTNKYGPAMPPYYTALHAEQLSDIIDDLTDRGTQARPAGFGDMVLQNWWRGRDRVWGGELFHAGNIQRTNSETQAKGGCFSRTALAMVMQGDVEPTESDEPKGLRSWEYGIFQSWGEIEVVDVHGVEVHSDATSNVT